jgi:hypothetical protein
VAETVADGDVWADDAEADPEGEPDPEADDDADADPEADGEVDPDGEGLSVLVVGLAGEVGVAPEALGEGDEEDEEDEEEGDGEGDGDGDGDGEGEGDGVLEAGSSWQVVSVSGDGLELDAAETGLSESARAFAGQSTASTPKISKPPASKLSVVARTCAKRIYCPVCAARPG